MMLSAKIRLPSDEMSTVLSISHLKFFKVCYPPMSLRREKQIVKDQKDLIDIMGY